MIGTYDELKAAVARWLTRSDLSDTIPDFIQLAESYLNRELRLRVMETEAPLTITAGTTSIALPTGYISPIGLWAVEAWGERPLRFQSSLQMLNLTAAGEEYNWSIDGPNIVISRPASGDMAISLRFVKAFALSDQEPENWLLTNHPDAYLFSALVEAAPMLRDDELLATWTARRDRAIDEINTKEARAAAFATLDTRQAVLPSERCQIGTGGYGRYG